MLDTVEKFKFKADIFENDFKRYLNGREDSINLLNKYVIILNLFGLSIRSIKLSLLPNLCMIFSVTTERIIIWFSLIGVDVKFVGIIRTQNKRKLS